MTYMPSQSNLTVPLRDGVFPITAYWTLYIRRQRWCDFFLGVQLLASKKPSIKDPAGIWDFGLIFGFLFFTVAIRRFAKWQ